MKNLFSPRRWSLPFLITASSVWLAAFAAAPQSTAGPSGAGFVDLPLDEALDTTNLVWVTGGGAPWLGEIDCTHDGSDAARSGAISDGQESWIETTVLLQAPGSVCFWWMVSCGYGDLGLKFTTNGVEAASSLEGEARWEKHTVPLPVGSHVLRWTMRNAAPGDEGQTAGWLDQVRVSGLGPEPPSITAQPVSLTKLVGKPAALVIHATGSPPLRFQWWKESSPIDRATNAALEFLPVQTSNAGTYYVTITNDYGSITSAAVALTPLGSIADAGCTGSLDPAFNAGTVTFENYAPELALVSVIVPQPGGRVIVAGQFSEAQGVRCPGIARFNADGSLDSTFILPNRFSSVRAILQLPDGKLLVGGLCAAVEGSSPQGLVRLDPDGNPDPTFNPTNAPAVYALALQPDGKILVSTYLEEAFPGNHAIVRLFPNGALDDTFQFENPLFIPINYLFVEAGGDIIFTGPHRCDSKGTFDFSFWPAVGDLFANAAVLDADGNIIVGGWRDLGYGRNSAALVRVRPDGSVDESFTPAIGGSSYGGRVP